ncbi:MAG: tetratricopeptide repeat protein [Planctomycetota bacterium]
MFAQATALLAAVCAASPDLEMLERARASLGSGDTERASALATKVLRSAGTKVRGAVALHREAQDVLVAAGRGAKLVAHYDRLLRRDVSSPECRYLRARVEPDPARKKSDLEAVLASSPEFFWAAYDLAELSAREGSWSRAARYAERAVKLRPGEAAAWNVLGHLRLEASRFLKDPTDRKALALRAREALEKAVGLDPGLAEAHYNLGLIAFALGEGAAARKSWESATRLRADFAEAWNMLGHLASREGRGDEAVALYKKAIALRKDYAVAHNNLAVAYYRKKDYARAQKHLALAEAAGHEPAASFKRVLVRALEERAFVDFQKRFVSEAKGRIRVYRAEEDKPVRVERLDRLRLSSAICKMRFRDSHGGVRLGERSVGGRSGAAVARYVRAARVEVELAGGSKRTLLVIARLPVRRDADEPAARSRRKLVTWIADEGRRFSAEAPELVKLVAGLADLRGPE